MVVELMNLEKELLFYTPFPGAYELNKVKAKKIKMQIPIFL